MRKQMLQVTIGIIIGSTVVLAAVFLWQLNTKIRLKADLERTKKESKQTQKDMRRFVELRKDPSGLEERAAAYARKIPLYETVPAGLMRQLLESGTAAGIKDIRFDHELNSALSDDQAKRKIDFIAAYAGPKIELEYFIMHCRASFQNLYAFLRRLYAIDRLVMLESLTVERRNDAVPEQAVSMVLITYMTNSTPAGR